MPGRGDIQSTAWNEEGLTVMRLQAELNMDIFRVWEMIESFKDLNVLFETALAKEMFRNGLGK
jgi:hypothetical protein